MNNWFQISYKPGSMGLEIKIEFTKLEDFPENTFGFIYIITNLETDKFYIGKKQLISVTNKKLGKKELLEQPIKPGRKVTKKKVTSESDWLNYWGSNKILLDDIKQLGYDKFEREIIHICQTKKLLTYYEAKYQMQSNVLSSNSYNDSIFGHFYRKDFI
jgi:hypothetical protein